MIKEIDLINSGYKSFQYPFYESKLGYKTSYQKQFRSDSGKILFFLNVHVFVMRNEYLIDNRPDQPNQSYSFEAQFENLEGTFNLEYLYRSNQSINHIETFFKTMFLRNNCISYDND